MNATFAASNSWNHDGLSPRAVSSSAMSCDGLSLASLYESGAADSLRQRVAMLEHANDTLRSRLAACDQLAAHVCHDLRGPLRNIEGFTALLLEDAGDAAGEAAVEHGQRILRSISRMAEVIDDYTALGRAGHQDLHEVEINLGEIAEEFLVDLASREPQRRMEINIAPNMIAHADPRLVRIALGNLISNAWKFTSTGEHARIELGIAAEDPEFTTFFIADNGVGFDCADSGRLFEPFTRILGSQEFEGTGLGLSAVAKAIARQGGRVTAEGKVGAGATFYFALPTHGGMSGTSAIAA
ncbi:MAG: signal transduction histidine kinase [Hyphomicrobiaceae bacterium]|jgi:signal transduction histidine kinase